MDTIGVNHLGSNYITEIVAAQNAVISHIGTVPNNSCRCRGNIIGMDIRWTGTANIVDSDIIYSRWASGKWCGGS